MLSKSRENNPMWKNIDIKEIIRLYTQEKQSSLKIAKIFEVDKATILNRLKSNGISRRTISESKKGKPTWNKGLHISEEHKRKVSLSEKGKIISEETKQRMSLSKQGEKSHFWKGGITKKNMKIRKSRRYKQWRNLVYKRDNYTCQKCRIKGYNLEAHHIIPFSECLQLDWEDMIFDINNGITYCKKCHRTKGET